MDAKIKKIVQQCVVRYLNGDFDTFEGLTKAAMEVWERDAHLYTPIRDLVQGKL
ncbi:MAG TPA: hypothetical protein VFC41_01515 [Anaerovoracaceae bacterium]|nr:hypothetical protein [Anaerovoracaceae bacterium]